MNLNSLQKSQNEEICKSEEIYDTIVYSLDTILHIQHSTTNTARIRVKNKPSMDEPQVRLLFKSISITRGGTKKLNHFLIKTPAICG